jgi:hypothetical protein
MDASECSSAQTQSIRSYPYQDLIQDLGIYHPYQPTAPPPLAPDRDALDLSELDMFIYQNEVVNPEISYAQKSYAANTQQFSSQKTFSTRPALSDPADPDNPATMIGYVSTTIEALLIFESCLTGVLSEKLIKSRLTENQREKIQSGSIFVYLEDDGPSKRQKRGVVNEARTHIPIRAEFQGGIKRQVTSLTFQLD